MRPPSASSVSPPPMPTDAASDEVGSVPAGLFDRATHTVPPPLPGDVQRGGPARDYSVRLVEDIGTIENECDRWRDLLDHSLDPNVFYSPEIFLSACRHLLQKERHAIVIIEGKDRGAPLQEPAWCGFFPFLCRSKWRGAPLKTWTMHGHDYCFLRTPLVRADDSRVVLETALAWLVKESGASLLEFPELTGDGPFHEQWVESLLKMGLRPSIVSTRVRAMLRRLASEDEYFARSISGGKLKELRRLERRLTEQEGGISFVSCGPPDDVDGALNDFLEVERSGWKGRDGTAMVCMPGSEAFFREASRGLFRIGRLRLHFIRGNERVIAGKCNFLAPPGAFAFKIGFAEDYAKFSPGVQLEIDNIRRFHRDAEIEWMDSCADANHPMIDHLWKERRSIHHWAIPLTRWGATVTSLLPWGAALRKGMVTPAPEESR